jgi:hypothetical protein
MSPEEYLLIAIVTLGEAFDTQTVLPDIPKLNTRHWRNRHSRKDERPMLSVRFVEVQADQDRQPFHTTDEACWSMEVELVLDVDLASETSLGDVTGVGHLTAYGVEVVKMLRDEEAGMLQYCDDIVDRGCGPDEDSSADEGRLVQSISVLYRTPTGDRSVLLGPGENL